MRETIEGCLGKCGLAHSCTVLYPDGNPPCFEVANDSASNNKSSPKSLCVQCYNYDCKKHQVDACDEFLSASEYLKRSETSGN